ncbi:M1 family metallopeptidase [Ichthyenterobacterium sp. W332]|uniref:Aminopeptidase N n=1 Tax=Microcosmobacter mediterraneus TaxID=3075607 RepID=A0ABU2YHY0_9FLAO|nr:M1 family metallopeptidase [Ichthyenterobacterium sp. W332]MDT0557417.1 M1 family metallopeptidase [Ichthyenterobacterium sp. W332]
MKYLYFFFILCFGHIVFAQQTEYIDFTKAEGLVIIKTDSLGIDINPKIIGQINYTFKTKSAINSVYIDAVNMDFKEIKFFKPNGERIKDIEYSYDTKRLTFHLKLKRNQKYKFHLYYVAKPEKAIYFLKRKGDIQIWTQGQGKYTSHWLPSFDDVNEKVEFDLWINYNNKYEVVSNGKIKTALEGSLETTFHYDMNQPMSSYLVALAIGKYNKITETSKSGIPLEYYYYPEDSAKVEPTYRYTKRMFDFLESEIDYPYPWQNYKQVPVHDFLYSGMENTSLTIFSDAFVIDSIAFNDKNYVNVNAHELAHQWFGDLVTAKSGEHHWLQEGFATYYALLAEREIFGDHYFYWKLYNSAQDLASQDLAKQGSKLLNPKASSLTFYEHGAWALYALREQVGDEAFKTAVKRYLEQHQFANVETQDFISEVEKASNQDLSGFASTWLTAETFPFNKALELLKNNSFFIQEYEMVDCEAKNARCDYYLTSTISDEAKSKIIAQVPERVTKEVFNSSLKVRQAIAQHVQTIPKDLKDHYETLLNDASYVTIEAALYNLWNNFSEDRYTYLDQTKDVVGFNDKNIRQLWLALALNTFGYEDGNKQAYYEELVHYTTSDFHFETRQLAFTYLNSLKAFNENALASLKDATTHHNWRFKKYAKELVEALSKHPDYKVILDRY